MRHHELAGRTLTAATFLGANTDTALERLADHLENTLAVTVDIRSATDGGWSSNDAERGATHVDILWICGRLLIDLQRQGTVRHTTVAAPVFEGERHAVYRSVLVARADGPPSLAAAQSGTLAVNEEQSWSGHHALRRHLGASPDDVGTWFAEQLFTGSHAASVAAVAAGEADCAAIDHTVWQAIGGTNPELTAPLRIIDSTRDWPAPPIALADSLNHNGQVAVTQSIMGAGNLPGVVTFVPASQSDYQVMVD